MLLHKGKSLNECESASYRPISLLSVTAKLVEKIVQQQMLNYLESTEQLNQMNNAYRNYHNMSTAIIPMTDALHEAMDRNMIATITTVDESCAFDCVLHDILIEKIQIYNFTDTMCRWFANYLNYRSQYVAVGAKKSTIKSVKMGIPQGSVLGPILYTLYINELSAATKDDFCMRHPQNNDDLFGSQCLSCGTILVFADDAMIIAASHSREANQLKLISNLSKVNDFLTCNKLAMNSTKTTLVESMVCQKKCKIRGIPPVYTR